MSRRRILVVEDDRTLRTALAFNLTREGYEVQTAVDGEQALGIARGSVTAHASRGAASLRSLLADQPGDLS